MSVRARLEVALGLGPDDCFFRNRFSAGIQEYLFDNSKVRSVRCNLLNMKLKEYFRAD